MRDAEEVCPLVWGRGGAVWASLAGSWGHHTGERLFGGLGVCHPFLLLEEDHGM